MTEKVVWFKDDQPVESLPSYCDRIKISDDGLTHLLTIERFGKKDEALYSCVVDDVMTSAFVTVEKGLCVNCCNIK